MVSNWFLYNNKYYRFVIDYAPNKGFYNLELVQAIDGPRVKIKTRAASGYAIKINKSGVYADGGARGAFNFLADCIKNDFMMCYVYKICELFA